MADSLGEPSSQELQGQSALLVGVRLTTAPSWETEDSLDELDRLADTATLTVVERVVQARRRIDPTHFIGKGKAAELKSLASSTGAGLIVFDDDLSPAQMRNLETLTDMRILDRSGLILDIFAQHASTRTAQLQVELAQLKYLLPRLTRQWTHLSRQAGGGAIRGMGAAGVRGPGETQLETDRRLIRDRISALTRELERIDGQMRTGRKSRADSFRVALVGYTNAGKSTLMRALSGSEVLIQDQLFATLDSTTRAVELDQSKRILLTDTVGFIRKLPQHLFASFRATLAETEEADLLLHVVDFSHDHYEAQIDAVDKVLAQLGVMDKPRVLVFNKIDQLEGEQHQRPTQESAPSDRVAVSALSGAGLDALKEIILHHCSQQDVTLELLIPQREGRLLSQLHEQGEVLERSYDAGDVRVRVRLGKVLADRWQLDRFAPVSVP